MKGTTVSITDKIQATTNQPAPCPVWPGLCADTTAGHYDHASADHTVVDKHGNPILDVTFLQFSDEEADAPAKISISGLGSEDYTPAEVHAATARIRRLLDVADSMADQATKGVAQDVPGPADQAFSTARAAIDAAIAMSSNLRQTRDALHVVVDMTFTELRADNTTR